MDGQASGNTTRYMYHLVDSNIRTATSQMQSYWRRTVKSAMHAYAQMFPSSGESSTWRFDDPARKRSRGPTHIKTQTLVFPPGMEACHGTWQPSSQSTQQQHKTTTDAHNSHTHPLCAPILRTLNGCVHHSEIAGIALCFLFFLGNPYSLFAFCNAWVDVEARRERATRG